MAEKKNNIENLLIPEVRDHFYDHIQNKMDGTTQVETLNESWTNLKDAYISAADTILGTKTRRKNEWISEATWAKVQERKMIKDKLNSAKTRAQKAQTAKQHQAINTEVKRSARRDKRLYIENLASQAQAAADAFNSRELYRITKHLANKNSVREQPVIDKSGNLLATTEQQLKRWEEHFRELMVEPNVPDIEETLVGQQQLRMLDININVPTKLEIMAALKKLKNNKAGGSDGIQPELLKADIIKSADFLYPVIKDIWSTQNIPDDWKVGIIIKLPKKGNLKDCNNWRGITLLNCASKILAQIIYNRLTDIIEPFLRQEQSGFRPRRSCIDQINSLRLIIEQSVEWNASLYMCFIDFKRAFDSLNHRALWNSLYKFGIPLKIINMIRLLYNNASSRVLHKGYLSGDIPVNAGVKQGCILSPLLFNIALDSVMRNVNSELNGITWDMCNQRKLCDLDYADDICLLAHTHADMEHLLQRLEQEAALVGLKINIDKTKEMRIGSNIPRKFAIQNQEIEQVTQFCYLGSMITPSGGADADVDLKLAKARQAFGILNKIWASTQISRTLKLRIFNTNVKSVLLYGCETWKVSNLVSQKLQVFVNRCLRRICNIRWFDRVSNIELLNRTQQDAIKLEIKKRKWGWIGHTLRRGNDCIAKKPWSGIHKVLGGLAVRA